MELTDQRVADSLRQAELFKALTHARTLVVSEAWRVVENPTIETLTALQEMLKAEAYQRAEFKASLAGAK